MYGLGAVSRMTYRSKLTTNPNQHANRGSAQAAPMNGPNGGADDPSLTEKMSEFIKGVKEKAAKLIELTEQIANGRFVGTNLAKNLREQAEGISAALDLLWGHITEVLMGSTSDSQDFAASGFSSRPEFGLNQILNVEKNITEENAYSELAIFSLARIRQESMKALQCQGNIEPEKAFFLLQDDGI